MNFVEMVQQLEKGKRARRKSWDNKKFHIFLNHKIIISSFNELFDEFDVYDYLANDWELYDLGPRYHSFFEIYKLMKKGMKVSRKAWGKSKFIYIDPIDNIVDQHKGCFTLLSDDLDNEDWYLISGNNSMEV